MLAKELYPEILDDPQDGEKSILSSCIDGIYRIALGEDYSVSENIDYFNDKILQDAVTDSCLSKLLEDYL